MYPSYNAASYGSYVLNGAAIPDTGQATLQPYQYDELAALYEGYICYGSRIRLSFTPTTASSILCCLSPQNDTTAPTSNARLPERPYVKSKIAVHGNSPAVLTQYRSCSAQFGVSKRKIASDDEFQGSLTSTTNPAQLAYWVFCSQNMDQTTATASVVNAQITYYCRLFKRKRVTAS